MPSQPAPMHTPEQIANLEAAKAAHARGELVQFRGIKGSPYKWCIYDAPFTWEKCYEYRPAPKPTNTPWRIMPQGEETRENCMDVLRVEDADGNLVFRASEVTHKQASPLERAYAEHIVHCVNHHAALLAALQKCKQVMSAAFDDIGQHLSVARYNLTGLTQTGDQMPIPDPPLLIHSKGIRDSEMVRELLREGIRTISAIANAQGNGGEGR